MKRLIILLSGLCLVLSASSSYAESVKLRNTSGQVIAADFTQGANDTGPILLLHGFLQTNKFTTIIRLETELNDSGYTVLSPTLSLGISNRKESLSCEAIHMHSMEKDADELRQWIEWLYKKTGRQVTVIGHSAAGPTVLKYMEDSNAMYIAHAILISLSYTNDRLYSSENFHHKEKALKAVNSGINPLDTYALHYCKNYPTDARAFLSYYNWNRAKVSKVVGEFNDHISIILGTGDKRVEPDWRQQLKEQNSNIILIEGANHFFDQAYEFDLTEAVEKILTEKVEY